MDKIIQYIIIKKILYHNFHIYVVIDTYLKKIKLKWIYLLKISLEIKYYKIYMLKLQILTNLN